MLIILLSVYGKKNKSIIIAINKILVMLLFGKKIFNQIPQLTKFYIISIIFGALGFVEISDTIKNIGFVE